MHIIDYFGEASPMLHRQCAAREYGSNGSVYAESVSFSWYQIHHNVSLDERSRIAEMVGGGYCCN